MNICVFGGSKDEIDEKYIKAGEKLGAAIARRGHVLIFGGGSGGLMGAAARGVSAAGGKSVGIIPEIFRTNGMHYEKCAEIIYTKTMSERKRMMEEQSDAFVITPGGLGTLDELFEVLALRHLGLHQKPIAFLNTSDYFANLDEMLRYMEKCGFMTEADRQLYQYFENENSLVEYLESFHILRFV